MTAAEPDEAARPRTPFVSDGCSGGLSWVWRRVYHVPPPWEGACVDHDRRYWRGGTPAERLDADRELRERIAGTGHPAIARIAFWAVRAGGHPWWPLPWRWNFGRPWPEGYADP